MEIKKAKLIITIVDRNKTEFYADVISQHESNLQMIMYGNGTAPTQALENLGLSNEKGIIFPLSIAPYKVAICALNTNDEACMSVANKIYNEFSF